MLVDADTTGILWAGCDRLGKPRREDGREAGAVGTALGKAACAREVATDARMDCAADNTCDAVAATRDTDADCVVVRVDGPAGASVCSGSDAQGSDSVTEGTGALGAGAVTAGAGVCVRDGAGVFNAASRRGNESLLAEAYPRDVDADEVEG